MAIIKYIERHKKTFNVKPHAHKNWEIIYVTEGSGAITTADGIALEYKKGDTICIPPNMEHVNVSSDGFKNIYFSIEDWEPLVHEPILVPHTEFSNDFYTVLKLTYKFYHKLPVDHPINIADANAVEVFLNSLIQSQNSSNITQIIVNEITNNYTDPKFDLEQAYKLIPLSKEHVRKLFIKEHHISPVKFLQQKRIALAKTLLLRKDDGYNRINKIAESCGFGDQAYFCRVFRREVGIAPSEYQLKFLEENKISTSET